MKGPLRTVSIALALLAAAGSVHAAESPTPAVIARLAVRSLLLDVERLPDGRLVAVGERGHVLASDDGGASWHQAPVPANANLTALHFADARRGLAVGHDEVILRTQDGGASWQVSHYAPEHEQPLLGVWCDEAGHGLAVGAFATVYRSDDAGATWRLEPFTPQPLPVERRTVAPKAAPKSAKDAMRDDDSIQQPHLTSVARDARGRLYVTGEAGHLYRSDDGGGHFWELPSPYEGSFFGLLPLDGDALLAFGLRGHLYRSEDAGQSWSAVASGTQVLLSGATRLADGTVVVAGLAGVVLVSRDGGRTFTLHQEPDRKGFDAVAEAPGAVVLVGEAGVRRLPIDALGPKG